MKVRLLHFAVLRDITGRAEEIFETAEGARAADVWTALRARHPELAAYAAPPLTAVNEEYADPQTELRDGDELAFIPPVAGG